MKSLKTAVIAAVLLVGSSAFAQTQVPPVNEPDYTKPKIFDDLPERMELKLGNFSDLLNLPEGAIVSAQIAEGFGVNGVVVSKSNPADTSVKSIVIRSINRPNTILTLSCITHKDGTKTYKGRMIGRQYGDALVIGEENGEYTIRKTDLYELMAE